MDNIVFDKIAKVIYEDCPHQGEDFPCEKHLPCIYAQGLATQISEIVEWGQFSAIEEVK